MPSARRACNGAAGDCSTLVVVVGFFLLLRAPHPPSAQRPHLLAQDSSQGHVSPMLAHLGALDRHLGANMSQHSPKMTPRCQTDAILETTLSQHRQRQPPRCLSHPFQAPHKCKKTKKTEGVPMSSTLQPWYQNRSKRLPEPLQKLPS